MSPHMPSNAVRRCGRPSHCKSLNASSRSVPAPALSLTELATVLGPTGRLHAIDTSQTMLQLSRQRCADQPWAEFHLADASLLPFDDDTFDAAVVVQVYEYVEDVAVDLRELTRVLRPGGRARRRG